MSWGKKATLPAEPTLASLYFSACSNCVAFIESSKSGKMDKGRVNLLADSTHVIGSLGFVRKCRKSWLAQGSSGILNKGIDKWNKD